MPRKHSGKLDVGGVVGTDGLLSVIYDAPGREPHTGSVPLVSGEIAEDFTAYFAASEQTPAACALGVLVAPDRSVLASGGYIARLLPGAPPELAEILERDIQGAGAVTPMLSQGGLDALVERVMRGVGARVLERSPVEYRCYCSRERVLAALASISRPELVEMLGVGEPMEVTCQFCDRIYTLDERALDEIIDTA
jgi:molecular chaperone Hsp33